ncbi:MFS transporter [Natrinema caseinilyticum]|uniref:MFS transporter n=1 Tax=Natrinema caseinilyticum TaxID=2961570 RepID=UPI0020C28085|nr:MFS transporter [Natrinema caseinilyticum]
MNWRYRHTALLLCTFAFMATMVARLVISPLVPAITDDFAVSNAALGTALSLMWGTYALTQFPSGILGDRFGERRVVLVSLGLTAISSVLLAVSPSYEFFVLSTVVLGLGAGLHYTVATTYLTKQFADTGRAIGVHIAGGPIAGLFAPVAATMVAVRYDWRVAMLLGFFTAAPLFALFAWRIRPTKPDRPEQPMRERIELGAMFELLSRPAVTYTMLISFLCAFTWQATASFLPAFLAEGKALSPAIASGLFSAYFVIHGLTQPLMGGLSDRIGRDRAAIVTMCAGIVGYGLLVVGATLLEFGVGVLFVGLAMSWGAPIQSRFMDLLSPAERGTGFGLVRTMYMTTGASGSVVVGALADLYGWDASFTLLVGIMSVALAALAANRVLRLGF